MVQITIRPVGPDELDAVTAVEAACFPPAEAADRETFRRRIEVFPECFFVAVCENRVIGFINGCATDERTIRDEMFTDAKLHKKDGCYQSIFGLAVLPDYQRQEVAARLMKHLVADARKRGRRGLILTCKERLLSYYEKFGYQNLGVSASVHGGAVWYDMLLVL
ncbi:MAG: GNAT family N-acetyltransferase [Lachnospiraceae bacterium]|nr:GNAT family N-acetyltransferase [Lachnospiraceae bacterium]